MAEVIEEILGTKEDTQQCRFLTFSLGKQDFGIDIAYVTEIIGIQPITEIPQLPEYAKGIINLRSKIIPIIDVRLRFKKEIREYTNRTSIIVINIKEISIGLVVDTVSDVVSISNKNIVPPPSIKTGFHINYIKGIGKIGNDIKLLLDCNKMFNESEIESLENVMY
jgi:purine-binding chemotaxis protein CheW